MNLTNTKIKNIKANGKTQKVSDGRGLYLEISPKGGKWWRLKYRFEGKEKRISLGVYPDVSLKMARDRRDEARRQVASDVDPSALRKIAKKEINSINSNTFKSIADEWFLKISPSWTKGYAKKLYRRLEKDIFPWLGDVPIKRISIPEIIKVLDRIQDRGAIDTAHRARTNIGQVFKYASQTGKIDKSLGDSLHGVLRPAEEKHFPAPTGEGDRKKIGPILRMIDGYQGGLIIKSALKLAPLLFVRPGELRHAKWNEIDFQKKRWCYFITKTKTDHIVPLCNQALEILKDLKPLTGEEEYVFPSPRNKKKPMSDNAMNAALKSMGISNKVLTPHGFRAIARTLIVENLKKYSKDMVERQLAHKSKDPLKGAYDRTEFLEDRTKMMQDWADYLDNLKK